MMKSIETLNKDVEALLSEGAEGTEDFKNLCKELGDKVADTVFTKLSQREHEPTLRMSNIGKADRQLWYSINEPDKGEDFSPATYLKFIYGDMLEELLFFLAKAAGHTVEGEQDEMQLEGLKGHRDGVVDGVLVDAKSASTYSFQKFKNGLVPETDAFGYIPQLQNYLDSSQNDDKVIDKTRAAFWVMDKQHGHLTLDFHNREENHDVSLREELDRKQRMLKGPVPPRCHNPVPDGKSGNMKLGVNCSYCAFKAHCWPNLRTFLYSNGPRFLTTVKRKPADHIFEVVQ